MAKVAARIRRPPLHRSATMQRAAVRFLRLSRLPILSQLQLEEALLRATKDNWFIVNDGTPEPTIVMGISGKVEELIDVPRARALGLKVIKRFSGGGTVVVDQDTVFTTLIMQEGAVPGLECFPAPIMRWTERFYAGVFEKHGDFSLREHDYVFGNRKFGGNAQAITSRRWLHHTSHLWDYRQEHMAALTNPAKQPKYREGRDHGAFLLRLKDHAACRAAFLQDLEKSAAEQFDLREASYEEAQEALGRDYLRGNRVLDLGEHLPSGS